MALPDPNTVGFDQVNAANETQTQALASYENAMAARDLRHQELQAAQAAADAADQAAQQALEAYDLAAADYDGERQQVGGSVIDSIQLPAGRRLAR